MTMMMMMMMQVLGLHPACFALSTQIGRVLL